MPGISSIAKVATGAVSAVITVDASRCVASRHRASSCRACVEACSCEALRFEAGRIAVDALACNGCLACAGVCPTEAISAEGRSDKALSKEADVALEHAGGISVFACNRAMDRTDLDLSGVVALPCLVRLDESLLCEQASRGAYRIVLVDANCAECPRKASKAVIDETVACANEALAVCDADVSVECASAFPDEVLVEGEGGYDASRRFLFAQAGQMAGEHVMKAVEDAVSDKAANPEEATMWNPLETFSVDKRMRMLNALDMMGAPETGRLDVRRYHTVSVDANRCTGCEVCAMFCPTGALQSTAGDSGESTLEWSAAECTGCSLCHDVCANDAIVLSPGVSCAELFDFEPRVLRGPSDAASQAPQRSSAWSPGAAGSLAKKFFVGNRAIDPAVERMRAKLGL